jgi:hypothetical protein
LQKKIFLFWTSGYYFGAQPVLKMFADIRTYEEFRATSLSDRVKLIEIGRTMVSPEVAAQAGVLAAKHASGAKVRPVFVPVCVP